MTDRVRVGYRIGSRERLTHCYWTEHRDEWPSDRAAFLEEIGLRTDPLEVRNVTRADLAVAMHEAAVGCNHYCATSGVLATDESRARHYALHVTQAAAVFAAMPQLEGMARDTFLLSTGVAFGGDPHDR